ncbi:MAG: NINE protein [Eudoraea sp.]|jgi:TM2 domain-containing membrane protein YozV
MAEDTNNSEEKAEGKFDKAKKKAKEFTEEAKESAKEFKEETKEAAENFTEGAKKSANEFKEGAKEAFGPDGDNKKILAGILAIVLGSLGVHKFILGYQKEGFILLGITIVGFALSCLGIGVFMVWITGLVGFIEGIIYLTKSDEDFYNTYQVGRKPWF